MVSIGDGAESQVEAQIASLGQNIILVFAGSATTGGARSGYGGAGTLTLEDAAAIKAEVRGIAGVSPEVRGQAQVLANGLNWATRILGESEDYLAMRQWPLSAGGNFTDQDIRGDAKVCIIGQTIVNNLFPDGDPVGKTLRLRNLPFKIIGVLAAKGFSLQGTDQDDFIMIPYTSAMKRFSRQSFLGTINVQAESPDTMPATEEDIGNLLRDRHHLTQGREDDFTVRDQQEIAEAATATTRTMTFLLGAIAGVSLLVGGIGIMNIMLVSVTERTREIGIRMAVGAHGSDIRMQFLIEAVVLSLMGGTLGIVLGIGASQFLSHLNHWPVLISTVAIVTAFVFSGAVGVCFGYYPASKAAQLDPIEALRYE
jgi:putative ABC transport system permease protein